MGQQVSQTTDGTPCSPPYIEYQLDSDASIGGVLRYAAYHKVMQNDQCDPSLRPLTIQGWTDYMMGDDHSSRLSAELTNLIKACAFQGFRFETKGTTAENAKSVHFEFALVSDDSLYSFASDADEDTFAEQLNGCPQDPYACVFTNLGGDATLVSPKNVAGDKNSYGHIAAFLRKAPDEQIQSVWKTVASTYNDQLQARSPATVWFSCAGGGVAWLHFRFDKRPKYYHYVPFKQSF